MRRITALAIVALGFLTSASRSTAQQQREPYPGFDAYVRTALTAWKVPGVSIAIVRNDSMSRPSGAPAISMMISASRL